MRRLLPAESRVSAVAAALSRARRYGANAPAPARAAPTGNGSKAAGPKDGGRSQPRRSSAGSRVVTLELGNGICAEVRAPYSAGESGVAARMGKASTVGHAERRRSGDKSAVRGDAHETLRPHVGAKPVAIGSEEEEEEKGKKENASEGGRVATGGSSSLSVQLGTAPVGSSLAPALAALVEAGHDAQLDVARAPSGRSDNTSLDATGAAGLGRAVLPQSLSSSLQLLLSLPACTDATLLQTLTAERAAVDGLPSLEAVTAAQADLAAYLRWIHETATRATGRRYEAAFPTWLVTRLWRQALPALRAACTELRPRGRRRHQRRHSTPLPVLSTMWLPASSAQAARGADNFVQSFRSARRALALRTEVLADALLREDSAEQLVLTLAQMQHCGALSDDVFGSITRKLLAHFSGDGSAPQQTAKNHLLTARMVLPVALPAGGPVAVAPQDSDGVQRMSASAALTMARLLGRQLAPNHFQLHQLTHAVLLPALLPELENSAAVVAGQVLPPPQQTQGQQQQQQRLPMSLQAGARESALARSLPSRAALEDLTSCFVHYAVSGRAVEHLTTLWQLYLTVPRSAGASQPFTLADCTALVNVLSRSPAAAAGHRRVRHPERASASSGIIARDSLRPSSKRESHVAVDDYVPLVEMVCARAAEECERQLHCLAHARTARGAGEPSVVASADSLTAPSAEPGEMASSSARMLAPSGSPAGAPLPATAALEWVVALLKVDSVHWASAYTLAATAALASLSAPRDVTGAHRRGATRARSGGMAAQTEADESLPLPIVQRALQAMMHRDTLIPDHPLHSVLLHRLLHSTDAMAHADAAGTALLAMERMTIPSRRTEEDVAAALALFRRHGRSLGLSAFVAGMCVVPLGSLPPASRQRVANHFTAVASALHPSWLARGIVAAAPQLTLPGTVGSDELSLQRWFSRFTAVDVTHQLDLAQCAGLLAVLAQQPQYLSNNAIACQTILRRVGALLRSETDGPVVLEVVPQLVSALQAARLLYAPLFSRLCRLLLAEVASPTLHASPKTALHAFAAIADEFARRSPGEAQGSVFRDAWELLRQRIIADAAQSLDMDDVVVALNGFASLDSEDRPLLLVLAHRLQTAVSAAIDGPPPAGGADTAATHDVEPDGVSSGADSGAAEAERTAQLRGDVSRHLFSTLSASAVAALVMTLLHKRCGADVDLLLPWCLLALAQPPEKTAASASNLYPIDVLQIMPVLLAAFTDATESAAQAPPRASADVKLAASSEHSAPAWGSDPLHAGLLHRAYDACRTPFILMYGCAEEDSPAPPSAGERELADASASASSLAPATADARAQWSPAVRASVNAVPHRYFARLLMELSSSGLKDAEVATACAVRCCTARCCQQTLSAQGLVDLCMSVCVQFEPVPAPAAPSHGERTALAPVSPNGRFMAPVLGALWGRTDELTDTQTHALLRCLRHHYGSHVDRDFEERLHAHLGLLDERKAKLAVAHAKAAQPTAGEAESSEKSMDDAPRPTGLPADPPHLAETPAAPAVTAEDSDTLALAMLDSLME